MPAGTFGEVDRRGPILDFVHLTAQGTPPHGNSADRRGRGLPRYGGHRNIGSVEDVAVLLNGMRDAGVISDYALFGAVAQMRYTEAVATLDADVLVVVPSPDRLEVLGPIYEYCRTRGYAPEGEAVRVGAWPVQFVPVFSELTRQAVSAAETADFAGVPFRVVAADYLAVIALSVGRAKDMARVLALLEAGAVSPEGVSALARRYGLQDAWTRFGSRFLDDGN
jgi:hypothetical protein